MTRSYNKLIGRIKELGLTQYDLAKKINVNKSTLSNKLNGKSEFTVKEIDDICRELNIDNAEIGLYFFG